MAPGRRLFFLALAGGSAAAALWLLASAIRADALSGQVFFALMPLAMLFGIAWQKLTDKGE
ncbi:hypothetical protein [Sinisalibacter lacisalsi]|uniref:Uncharacterized protein n=1 Tax=Sinisalibacter lacisalsi TaxID=1526570 RepID=A0ABQ1QIT3_9RHOB|nr:hypothetical protein [Sinisalibacter lacisalsi]GGD29230.1 hypothetical protein GCM10011358_11600 [Sinisalibacter lacisalsi]